MERNVCSTPPYASSPFDDPEADLILRSSDNVDFRVSRFILKISSQFFADMFAAGQVSDDELRDGCPIVQMQEDSKTLDVLLRVIYPTKAPVLDQLPKLHAVLGAALKFDMDYATELARTALRSFIAKEPVRVWAIAVRNRLEPESRAAADEMNRQHISVLDSFPSEMQAIDAGAYYRLLRYRRLQGAVETDFKFCDPPTTSPVSPPASSSPAGTQIISPKHSRIQPLADILCRSADGQKFPAHKVLLALASPVMAAMMLSLPTAAANSPDMEGGLPMLSFEEDAATLGVVLGLCALEGEVAVQELQVLQNVIEAAKKYEMDDARKLLQDQWTKLSASDPLRVFLFAASRKAHAEARQAAQQLLDRTLDDYYTSALEISAASMYRALCMYHNSCRSSIHNTGRSLAHLPTTAKVIYDVKIPIKASRCRSTYMNEYYGSSYTCRGVEVLRNLDRNPQACEPCVQLGQIIVNALQQSKTEPSVLIATSELLQDCPGSIFSNPYCSACSQPADRTLLTTFLKGLCSEVREHIDKEFSKHIGEPLKIERP